MKTKFARTLTSFLVAVSLTVSTAGIASADSLDKYFLNNQQNFSASEIDSFQIEKIVDNAKDALDIEQTSQQVKPEITGSDISFATDTGTTHIHVDSKNIELNPKTVDGSNPPLFTMKTDSADDSYSVRPDGSTVVSANDKHFVIDSYEDSSLRIQTVIESRTAEHEIQVELGLSQDEVAEIEADGSVGFYRRFDGENKRLLTSIIDKPWAVDANGTPVDTWFRLDGNKLVQVVDTDETTAYPVTADPFWIPAIIAGPRLGAHVLIKVGPRIVKYAVAPGARVVNALRSFSTLTFRAGSNIVRLDKSAMKHILQRHHPQYWNGTKSSIQSFFNPRMSVSDVRSTIHGALRNHSSAIRKLGTRRGSYYGTYNGVKYKLTIDNGRVVQFYPR